MEIQDYLLVDSRGLAHDGGDPDHFWGTTPTNLPGRFCDIPLQGSQDFPALGSPESLCHGG